MLNKLLVLTIILFAGFGCGALDKAKRAAAEPDTNASKIEVNSNKSLTDAAVDAASGEKKIGIVECDDALAILAAQADDPDDSFVTKALKKTALKTFRDQVNKKLDEQKADRKEVAKYCKEFRDSLDDDSSNGNTNTNTAH